KFLYLVIEKLMSLITDSIICVSDFDKQLALKYRFNRLKLTTIHNGIADVPAVKQTLKSQSHNNIGEVVGMLPNKQDLQINAP
ncbi:glycosyltransferase family 1 protein, partial [Xanthomonas citri pv. citri]|nr:glycosyltransferase family 1 protein [Xanthomonas citri pv. citri]